MAWGYVVPRWIGGGCRRVNPVRAQAPTFASAHVRRDRLRRTDRFVLWTHRQLYQRGVIRPAQRRFMGSRVSSWWTLAATPQPIIRGHVGGAAAIFRVVCCEPTHERSRTTRRSDRDLLRGICLGSGTGRIISPARCAPWLYIGSDDHGPITVGSIARAGCLSDLAGKNDGRLIRRSQVRILPGAPSFQPEKSMISQGLGRCCARNTVLYHPISSRIISFLMWD